MTRSWQNQIFNTSWLLQSVELIKKGRPDIRLEILSLRFPEFVRYLIKTRVEQYDEHWEPISLRCRWDTILTLTSNNINFRVCQLSYKFILRYENLEDDWQQFLEDAGIREDLDLAWVNRSGGGDYRDYYKDLTDLDIIKLYQKFESDFLMFGYTLEGYLHQKSFWSQIVNSKGAFFFYFFFLSLHLPFLCLCCVRYLSSLQNLK